MFIKYLYFILVSINFFVMLTDKKKSNFITIYFLSSLVYYLNSFFGEIYYKLNNTIFSYDINEKTYHILCINMLIILFFQLLPNFSFKKSKKLKYIDKPKKKLSMNHLIGERATMSFVGFVMLIMGVYVILRYNLLSSTSFNKTAILENTTFIVTYYKNVSLFLFLYIFINEKNKFSWITYATTLFSVLVTFLLGHRSYIVIGVLGISFNYIIKKLLKEKNLLAFLLRNKKVIVLGLGLVLTVYSVKGIFNPLITGQYELVKERLSDPSFYLDSFRISESNSIFSYIDRIVSYDYRINQSTYIIIPSYFIPFISRYLPSTTFGTLLQRDLFPNLRAGSLGSTYIGEAYANGGYFMVIAIIIIVMIFLKIIFSLYKNVNSNYLKTFLLLCGIEFSFYIHRNGLGTVILRIRVYLYIMILLLVLNFLFKAASKTIDNNYYFNKDISVKDLNSK